ncbi:MAG TPA: hypothetical protein VEA41_02555, partial [Salinarimonas sp.]|nr:hypothetical protein [Salinarimonas sp.]
ALAGVAVLVLRLAAAERAERRATLAAAAGDTVRVAVEANRAAQLNPWEMQYRLNQLATLHGMTFLAPEAERPGMAGLAVRIAREAAEMHPRDPGAHEVLGTALLHETMHTRPDRTSAAQAALDRAQDLAPTYVPLMERRIALAGARGDIARRVLIEADRCAVLETTGEGACR